MQMNYKLLSFKPDKMYNRFCYLVLAAVLSHVRSIPAQKTWI